MSAIFSPDRVYRYQLTRDIPNAPSSERLAFIMLNPSTADETVDDPTIRRCIGFAKAWGFSKVRIGNLFALRSTDPAGLRTVDDPIGPDNNGHLIDLAHNLSDMVVCAWGVHGAFRDRGVAVRGLLDNWGVGLWHLGLTKGGHPKHPLYLRADTKPTRWT